MGIIRTLIWVIFKVTLLITPLRTTHEPPSGICEPDSGTQEGHVHRHFRAYVVVLLGSYG